MSQIDDLREQIKHLERQERLEAKLAEAAAAHAESGDEKDLRAHDRAAVALAEHRASQRTAGGPSVGGDAFVTDTDQPQEG